ncbi:hypothetical protein [Qipengyuania seohaensis]|uniref:hypothetical protein n=1 Tax=Qipengyuania seohaensis TaxID=266951 RepID=UPI0018E28756|nr:hypothetical protein [Qipengyuania seohaensis]
MAILGLTLSACGSAHDGAPDYRYRLTVEVDTPEGVRSGSSVIEVEQSMGRTAMSGFGKRINRRARGEAVSVDLPDGRTLFALLRSEDDVDWASVVMQTAAPQIAGESFEEKFDNMLLIKGERVLPRYWPPYPGGLVISGYPMLVTFEDLDDPTSVMRVDPDDLAATFGEGVSLKRITVAITQDPVTTGIEQRLVWLGQIKGMGLSRKDFPEDVPVGAFSEMFRKGI